MTDVLMQLPSCFRHFLNAPTHASNHTDELTSILACALLCQNSNLRGLNFMKKPFLNLCCIGVFILAADTALAAPSGAQICKKMISDGRGGGLSQAQCECHHRYADAILDDNVKALLFEAWYTGANNMKALEKLPNPGRVNRKMRSLQKAINTNCQ
jgi:hypothetical protein